MLSSIMPFASFVVRLGMAVWDAVEAGDTTRTVGEIFASVPKDEVELDRLREAAKAKFGTPSP